MQRCAIWAAVVLSLAGWTSAQTGDLADKPCPPGQAIQHQPLFAAGSALAKPAKDAGTVNSHAVVVTFGRGKPAIKVAIDSQKGDADAPDVVRFDFTGRGRFAEAPVAPLRVKSPRSAPNWFQADFGPVTLQVRRGDETIPVTAQGQYLRSGSHRQVQLTLGRCRQGRCAFGDKTYSVRLIDGNSDLDVTDAPGAKLVQGRVQMQRGPYGDTLLIDTGDGTFQTPKQLIRAFVGQPVWIDGTWYRVNISAGAKKASAEKIDLKTGRFTIGRSSWSGVWISDRHVLHLSGGKEPVEIPTGSYAVVNYRETIRDSSGRAAILHRGDREAHMGRAKVFHLPAGQTTTLAIGSPLTAGLEVTQRDRSVQFTLDLKDVSGATVDYLQTPGGRPPAPTIEVHDRKGQLVHSGRMRYG